MGSFILSVTKKSEELLSFFASLPFITYLCNERLKPSIHCVELLRKIAQIARVLSK